ncbi:hypothetical protein IPH92_02620 [Candidatus Kaiserbacteria bacterium]|nr:MAG: hypothetical protein IPH92_02620 [Candidatus Kaiserbacteria bacterium]
MQRIILSLALIGVVTGGLVFGATSAFFSDTETSVANVFTAGAIDLKVDNESYYNGVATSTTSWDATNLTIEKFFNFFDLKPDDYGEDTISLHVDTNDAYLCANVTLTSNNENAQTEPEALVDLTTGATEGELAGLVNFIWWADDGDNVLEVGESVINTGNFGQLGVGNSYALTFADSVKNIWTNQAGPIPGNTTKHIGKAWCFGTIVPAPLPQVITVLPQTITVEHRQSASPKTVDILAMVLPSVMKVRPTHSLPTLYLKQCRQGIMQTLSVPKTAPL